MCVCVCVCVCLDWSCSASFLGQYNNNNNNNKKKERKRERKRERRRSQRLIQRGLCTGLDRRMKMAAGRRVLDKFLFFFFSPPPALPVSCYQKKTSHTTTFKPIGRMLEQLKVDANHFLVVMKMISSPEEMTQLTSDYGFIRSLI